jgi:hypothetical protein
MLGLTCCTIRNITQNLKFKIKIYQYNDNLKMGVQPTPKMPSQTVSSAETTVCTTFTETCCNFS